MPNVNPQKASARERLLTAADDLFYHEGVQTVGIDRIIEQAGVAKASLYNIFGSKDELVRAYLESRHASTSKHIERTLSRFRTPRERLLGVFDAQGEVFCSAGFNGCAFMAASAEAPHGSSAEAAAENYRAWIRNLFTDLAKDAGVVAPEDLARQLHLLYDGAGIAARMDKDPSAATTARTAAALLYDAAPKDEDAADQRPTAIAASRRPAASS